MDVLCHSASIQSFRIYCARRDRDRERERARAREGEFLCPKCFKCFMLCSSLSGPVRAILSEVGEFEKSFLMFLPTGLQPINNVCCWQVGNLKGGKWRNGTEKSEVRRVWTRKRRI